MLRRRSSLATTRMASGVRGQFSFMNNADTSGGESRDRFGGQQFVSPNMRDDAANGKIQGGFASGKRPFVNKKQKPEEMFPIDRNLAFATGMFTLICGFMAATYVRDMSVQSEARQLRVLEQIAMAEVLRIFGGVSSSDASDEDGAADHAAHDDPLQWVEGADANQGDAILASTAVAEVRADVNNALVALLCPALVPASDSAEG
jgi:hypothetical protein